MAKVTRREFLKTVVVSAGAASLGPSVFGCDGPPPRPLEEVFPQSVASGDPREGSIVLWTRALPADEGLDAAVRLEVATDEELTSLVSLSVSTFSARAASDHCVRAKIVGLSAGTTYYYRFEHAGTRSRVGRFRTAAAADADEPVRFAVLSCQDFVGRYYNSLLPLLDSAHDDLAFVVHLGDYVYETTGDPGFMMSGSERVVSMRDPEEAIAFGTGEDTFYAARSVSNYRDLYRTYRSDPILQRVHERFAFVCVWDDHEFSDDSWQDTATYTDGVLDETDRERKLNAEQVYFEYMPLAREDEGDGELTADRAALFPNTRLFRSLRFGQHLSLALTDYRSFRPDHPVPEDAYPGAIVLDQAQLTATLERLEADGDLPADVTAEDAFATGGFSTYVDLDDAAFADHQRALELLLTAGYAARGVPEERAAALAARYAAGKTDAAILLATIDAGRAGLPAELQGVTVDPTDTSLERGLPYALMAKGNLTGQLGARYLVVQKPYDLVQAYRTRIAGDDAHDDVLGADQEAWLRAEVSASDATWNVVGSSVCNTSLFLDLEPFAASLPPGLPPVNYYLNVDQWDGFPERRRALMREVYRPANVILLAGDIHAAYATDFGADAEGNRTIELTTPAVSSGTFRELLFRTGSAVPAIRDSGLLEPVLDALDSFLQRTFPGIVFSESNLNGALVVSADATQLRADYHLLAPDVVLESYYDRQGDLPSSVRTFTVAKSGGRNGPLTALE